MVDEKPVEQQIESIPVKEEDVGKAKKKGRFFGDPIIEFD
jgi:hypothetical protein